MKIYKLQIFVSILSAMCCAGIAGAQEASVIVEESVILTPSTGGLQDRETAELEREYRYQFRNKGIIQEAHVSVPYSEPPEISGITGGYQTEEEKLYRYFGIATVFHEVGQLEEAIEMLEYIVHKKPNDEYVKNYLKKVKRELNKRQKGWKGTVKKDTGRSRKIRIDALREDGIAYYKQRRYDEALLRFSEVLGFSPNDGVAKSYMNKLKDYYSKEVKAESIADSALDIAESKKAKSRLAKKLTNKEELANIVLSKKADSLLSLTERDLKISQIINSKREEERRSKLFTVGPGDELRVSVRDHPELSGSTIVRPEGVIVLPLVNEAVKAIGLTLEELRAEVINTLDRYVKDPIVFVGIESFRSKVFYVIDEQGATPYNITRMNMTLRDALFISDWGDNRALGRIIIIRPDPLHPVIKKVDAFDMIYRGNLAHNIRIEDGDVIYIPMTAAAKITDTISDTLSPIKQIKEIRDEWIDVRWNREAGWRHLMDVPQNQTEMNIYGDRVDNDN